jgi:ankyrin repeat protein
VAVRRGQQPDIVKLLLDHGADVGARRGDGRTAWLLARRGGFDQLVALLEQSGAAPEALSAADELMAACGRGDAAQARRLTSPELVASLEPEDLRLMPSAASRGQIQIVVACLEAGFPVDTPDETGATALHHAAIHGRAEIAAELLRRGAQLGIHDGEHRSTPIGWACFGADHVPDPEGDYAETVRALLQAGARHSADDHQPAHPGVREILRAYAHGESSR